MYITVRIYDTLREFAKGQGKIEMMLIDGSTVWDAALATGIPEDQLGVCVGPRGFLDPDALLIDGTNFTLYPPILGA